MKIKNIISIVLVFVLSFGICSVAFADVTAEVPDGYAPIYTAEDLNNIRNNLDGKYILMNDIDLSVYENWEPIGSSETPFIGELDGNGKSVLNLSVKDYRVSENKIYVGMFSFLGSCSVINLNLINVDIDIQNKAADSAALRVGALAGYASDPVVENCAVTGNINVKNFSTGYVGGLFGLESVIMSQTKCANYADISVSSDYFNNISVGGVAGSALWLEECCNYGSISVSSNDTDDADSDVYIGGICGKPTLGSIIYNCYNRGPISLDFTTPSTYVGGIIGQCVNLENCYNSGKISHPYIIEIFAGAIAGEILMMLSTGGRVSYIDTAYYTNSNVSCVFRPDEYDDINNVKQLEIQEFRKQESFVGFDFENIWEMEENGYPVLKNQPEVPEYRIPIYTAEDLNDIRNDLDGKYILMNDIDLSAYDNWIPIGSSDTPFTGEFNGNGYQLKNLKIADNLTEDKTYYYGLFGYTSDAAIEKVTLVDCNINVKYTGENKGKIRIGAIAGYCYETKITDCTVLGDVIAGGFFEAVVGGLIGRVKMSVIARCSNYADVIVESDKYADEVTEGGVIGDLTVASTISESSNHGNVSLVGEAGSGYCYMRTGGVCGGCADMWESTNVVADCYNDGTVSTDCISETTFIGGICGESYETQSVYNVGDIVVPEGFEGLAGAISGNIFYSWLAIGMPHYMQNTYYINADMIPSYEFESMPDSFEEKPFINVKLLSEEEFRKKESFVGFDFENIWEMEENGYPVLKNQPEFTVKESIELKAGQRYLAAPGSYYHTTDETVAKTDVEGRIVAIGEGTAVITISYSDKYTKEITVTVYGESESFNNVESAEIVYVPLKNRIVFSAGSPALPDGIVLKLKYKDGSEKTETVIYNVAEGCYRAGDETVIGSVRAAVVEYGLLTDTLYINDNTVSISYKYFVPPTLSYIFMEIVNFVLRIVL